MSEATHLKILYQDDHLIAINKPNGLLVHRSPIASDATIFALQLVRDQTGKRVYPIHRLDRKTSGVLVFAFASEVARVIQDQLKNHTVTKKYLAIVRGFFPNEVNVDYSLINDKGKRQDAVTFFKCVNQTELSIPFGKHQTSRYSLIEAYPKTGRMHQIRKHLNHLRHPIIGDRPHGCNKQNRLFKERWNLTTMLLHAAELHIKHPVNGEGLCVQADLPDEFLRMRKTLSL